MKKKIALFITAALVAGGIFTTHSMVAAEGKGKHELHPHIHRAIAELEETKHELKTAAHDFGGHREAALKECEAAIEQLRLCLKFDKK